MRFGKEEVCVFIPALNEAPTVGELITNFRNHGFTTIFVMDGNSIDNTAEIAKTAGAVVQVQSGKGKGNAIREALTTIQSPYVLMVDGDGTYTPDDAEKMLDPLSRGYDHVIGDRLCSPDPGSFSRLNLLGNQLINLLFKMAHGKDLHDILSGYRAFSRESFTQMRLYESGFGIETEMSVEAVRNNQRIAVVPVHYRKRTGTHTKLSPLNDGLKIATTIYRLAKVNNPIFFFGLMGALMAILGSLVGVYVILEWLQGIDHIPLTILTVLLIMVGFEIFMFGVISDLILGFHREVIREIQLLQPPKK
ncbi:MAG: S-layer glycoprotein N-glycosyltransferase AglJ [Methanomicrobiales archaeon]|nr:S-layer glycoprotein N-glycosyltransferase AglJ [Methanomicrobiales archaeon]